MSPSSHNRTLITPPVGVVLNVVGAVAGVSVSETTRGVWPFLVAQTLVLLLLIFVPQIVTVPLSWLH